MVQIWALWLPIVLSAVVVFFASSILHMVLSAWHRGDYAQLPGGWISPWTGRGTCSRDRRSRRCHRRNHI